MTIETVRTEDGIELKGLFLNASNSNRVCLFIPGCCGNFVDNNFLRIISDELAKNDFSVLCANTRGSFMMNSSFHPQNLEKPKQIGVAYEYFEDCIYDINIWLNYLFSKGYDQIDVICHSSGANKFIYYMNSNANGKQFVNNIILLSPPDFVNRIKSYNDYDSLIKKARDNVDNGLPEELIKVHFFYKTSQSFLDMMNSKNFDNLPLVNGIKRDFYQYEKIRNPITIIYGSKEKYIKNYINKLIMYANPNVKVECYEVINADHIYYGKEKDVGKIIAECLNRRYLSNKEFSLALRK